MIQFSSQVAPASAEKACVQHAEFGVMSEKGSGIP